MRSILIMDEMSLQYRNYSFLLWRVFLVAISRQDLTLMGIESVEGQGQVGRLVTVARKGCFGRQGANKRRKLHE